ncbi:unnamed protein product, partial [Vitis vinifera]|uniref:Uncharacterized protein n=1 Tax=Vitis vinifera TaxID=29760 RepID=D7SK12_VITVI
MKFLEVKKNSVLSIPLLRKKVIDIQVKKEFSTKSKPAQPSLLSIYLLLDSITTILHL